MIAQTYCGEAYKTKRDAHSYWCNPTDGPCPSCLRGHVARLEERIRELHELLADRNLDLCEMAEKVATVGKQRDTAEARVRELEDQAAAQAGGVAPDLTERQRKMAEECCGDDDYPDLDSWMLDGKIVDLVDLVAKLYKAHTLPASRVLGEGFVAVDQGELEALNAIVTEAERIIGEDGGHRQWDLGSLNSLVDELADLRAARGGAT